MKKAVIAVVLSVVGTYAVFLGACHVAAWVQTAEYDERRSVREAESLGRDMAHQDAEADANPFEASTPEAKAWAKGWAETRKKRERWERQLDAGEVPTL